MLKHWATLLNTDCKVLQVGEHTVYPIFKNGFSSLTKASTKVYTDQEISQCNNIHVLVRDPEQRFVSGVNEYCNINNVGIERTYELIKQGKIMDRHFAPQYLWLVHLYKFYKGNVTLKPFTYIQNITSIHEITIGDNKIEVEALEDFVSVDRQLMKLVNQTHDLGELISKYKHALS